MTDTAAALHDVTKKFKNLEVLSNASIDFPVGAITGVQGPNGSGKSVLFKLICGFLRPEGGEVYLNPRYIKPGNDYPTDFGIIIDRPGYLGGLTGIDNLRELARIRGIATDADITAAMERVGLPPSTTQKVRNYSLGMKQKLGLAQAFMEGQQLLLLDEAFNGLDTSSVALVRQLFLDLRDEGRTIVMTSHHQEDITTVCDHVWQLDNRTFTQTL